MAIIPTRVVSTTVARETLASAVYLSITSTGKVIDTASNNAVYERTGINVSITNNGTIFENAAGYQGIYLLGTASVQNNGFIYGNYGGIVQRNDYHSIVNSGTIAGSYFGIDSKTTTIDNIVNTSLGVILATGLKGTVPYSAAVYQGGAGSYDTVINYGTIKAGTGIYYGVRQSGGGNATLGQTIGLVSNLAGGLIEGSYGAAVAQIALNNTYGTYQLFNAGTILNTGTNVVSNAVFFAANGTITNAAGGVISGGQDGILVGATASKGFALTVADNVSIINAGIIEGKVGIESGANTTNLLIENTGLISGSSGTAIEAVSGTVVLQEAVNAGIVGGVTVKPGAGNVLELLSGSTAGTISGIGSTITGFTTIAIDPGAAWTLSGNKAGLANGQVITGFTIGDTIDLTGVNATSESYANGLLTLSNGTNVLATLTLTEPGTLVSGNFHVNTDSVGTGTNITESTICFAAGTQIATLRGEVAVETLTIGDEVITRFGGVRAIKWIGRQAYAQPFLGRQTDRLPVRIEAGALGGGLPLRPLAISPGHSVLLGETLVLAKHLVNGVTITQPNVEAVEYFNIEFETHDCVLADGSWAESYADEPGLRGQFHNAAEFYALYPYHVDAVALQLCARRPEHGPELVSALAPVVARATSLVEPGKMRGFVDVIRENGLVEGWALDEANPQLPVQLEFLHEGKVIGTALACNPRPDVAAAGFGFGRNGFRFQAPAGLDITVRRAGDAAELRVVKRLAA